MKTLLPFALCVTALTGINCSPARELEATLEQVELIKIQTVTRYRDIDKKMLTWKTANNVYYVTFEPEITDLVLGTRRIMMVPK